MKIAFILFNLMLINHVFSQGTTEYYNLVKKADSLFKIKEFKNSAFMFSSAFESNGGLALDKDRYNAACSWALANNPDSAFFQLNRIAIKGNYMDYNHIISDSDLNYLHDDKRWDLLLDIIKTNKLKAERMLNKPLVLQLDSIYNDDQNYRQTINDVVKKYGLESKQMKDLMHLIKLKDSVNVIKVKTILDEYGWPEEETVGEKGSITLFLVIQHADTATQRKYLPVLKEAVKNGKAKPYYLAFLEDRVALSEGKKQIYGTQIYRTPQGNKIAPIEDEKNVDTRRKLVGLNPLEEYAKQWDIDYHLPISSL